MPKAPDEPATPATGHKPWLALAAAIAVIALAAIAAIGGPHDAATGLIVVLERLIIAGAPAAAYILGGIGLGRLFRPITRHAEQRAAIEAGLGIATLLSISHAIMLAGLVRGNAATIASWAPIALGLALLALNWRARTSRPTSPEGWRWGILAIPPVALMIVAASSPPGWLWESEARGYDVLSYHLQLPQEWLAKGRLAPLHHNVYSFLPGYVEAAFMHLAVMTAAPGPGASEPWGLLAGSGHRAIAAHMLHAGMGLLAAWIIARWVRSLMPALKHDVSAPVAILVGVALLAIPWVIVVGSLAYNELAVLALMTAAMIAAADPRLAPANRGITAGLLVGVACGCKPTALLFAGLPVGIALLASAAPRQWWRAVLPGAIVGVLALLPWLVRNHLAAGNPIFPFAADLLGHGHWSAEQAARHAAAHHFSGTLADRLRLLVLIDPADPAGPRHRGLMHPQWSVLFPIAAAAMGLALALRHSRRAAAILTAALLAQLAAWLFATHLQSRFLIPLAVPALGLIALAAASLPPRPGRLALAGLVTLLTISSLRVFQREPVSPPGMPNALLALGTSLRTGEADRPALARAATPRDRAAVIDSLGPEATANLLLPPEGGVLLLGDATPFYYTRPVRYATTWDTHPLADILRQRPGEPEGPAGAAWAGELRKQGVRFVVANFAELDRLRRSGWLDPDLEPAAIERWLRTHARPIRAWPELGVVLVELAQH